MGKYANHDEFGVNAPINYREDTTSESYLKGMAVIAPPGMRPKSERGQKFEKKTGKVFKELPAGEQIKMLKQWRKNKYKKRLKKLMKKRWTKSKRIKIKIKKFEKKTGKKFH